MTCNLNHKKNVIPAINKITVVGEKLCPMFLSCFMIQQYLLRAALSVQMKFDFSSRCYLATNYT